MDQCSLALFSSSVVLLDHLILRAACIRQGGTRARKSLLIGVYIRCSYKETENLFGFRSSGLEVPIVNAGGFTEIQFQTCPLFGVCHRLGRAVHIGSYACMLSPQLMNWFRIGLGSWPCWWRCVLGNGFWGFRSSCQALALSTCCLWISMYSFQLLLRCCFCLLTAMVIMD